MDDKGTQRTVLIIGAGPAGLFAARKLAAEGFRIALINRDIKPGGMAEYGIFYKKYRMKETLRKQFHQIIENSEIDYFGNVTVGAGKDVEFKELTDLGFDAILVAAGAQGTKWLGLPGEDLEGIYHAKELVYYTNKLPPFSERKPELSGRIALIGAGNVMVDIARWLIHDLKVDEVTVFVRRGPGEVKFSLDGFAHIIGNLDLQDLEKEFSRCESRMTAIGQDINEQREHFLSALQKVDPADSPSRLRFRFFSRPTKILGNSANHVNRIEIEDTKISLENESLSLIGMGTYETFEVDHVIYCVGDTVDPEFGLPMKQQQYATNPKPLHPVNAISYEAYDEKRNIPLDGVFIAGWSRKASTGLMGIARKDSECAGSAIIEYLSTKPENQKSESAINALKNLLEKKAVRAVSKTELFKLEEIEQQRKMESGADDFKFATNVEMLEAIKG